MSSRINIARPRDPTGYSNGPSYGNDPHGFATRAPAYQTSSPANPDDPLEKIRAYASKIEDMVEIYSQPLKPHLPAIGRFLIVVTFIEDAIRITTQWSDQNWYLQKYVSASQA
jgi:ER-derived vesicles protein